MSYKQDLEDARIRIKELEEKFRHEQTREMTTEKTNKRLEKIESFLEKEFDFICESKRIK